MVGGIGPQEVVILLVWVVPLGATVAGVWLAMNRLGGRRR